MIKKILIATSLGLLFSTAHANQILTKYPNGNAEAGQKLFFSKNINGNFESCVSCHTDNLKGNGKHVKTNKEIKPLAPIANPGRFTDLAKVNKWLRRNCIDVLSRECSNKEKADVIAYLMSIK